jgi:hypothetical protein
MGLIRGMARTAVIAGTATAVSNRVSRRQNERWAQREQAAYERTEPMGPPDTDDDLTSRLDRLTEMKVRGQLSDEEFRAAKAQLLGL